MGVKEIPFHPLCCICTLTPSDPDSLPQHQDQSSLSLSLPWARSLPCFESAAVWRWFCLKDRVLYYSKLLRSHCVSNLLIGEGDDFRDLIESMMDEEGLMKLVTPRFPHRRARHF